MWQSFLDFTWFNIVYPLLLLAAVVLGILFAIRYKKKREWESSGIESSIIGIFGLIISFTFLTSGNAHRERYSFIHQEANSAELLYRYSKEMPDTFARETKIFLINFLENQGSYGKKGDDSAKLAMSRAIQLLDNYWEFKTAFKLKSKDPSTDRKLEKISDCYDNIKSSLSRIAYSYNERTPAAVMYLLITASLLIGFLVGFMNGVKAYIHYLLPIIYIVFISFIMLVIRDLNNPFSGFIKPSYKDLVYVNEYIKKH